MFGFFFVKPNKTNSDFVKKKKEAWNNEVFYNFLYWKLLEIIVHTLEVDPVENNCSHTKNTGKLRVPLLFASNKLPIVYGMNLTPLYFNIHKQNCETKKKWKAQKEKKNHGLWTNDKWCIKRIKLTNEFPNNPLYSLHRLCTLKLLFFL